MTIEDFRPCTECKNMLLCCDIAKCAKDYHIPPGPPPEQIAEKLAKLIATARKNTQNK